nr:unnamed protein product [Callosobruchus chinensis]
MLAAALLGASTSSLCGYRTAGSAGRQPQRRIDEEDLSTPYNHYKCLSPKQRTGKLLRRQFSLDRAEEAHRTEEALQTKSPRLCKQNSAGAADLEKIEEVPTRLPTVSPAGLSPIQCQLSVSADSLMRSSPSPS